MSSRYWHWATLLMRLISSSQIWRPSWLWSRTRQASCSPQSCSRDAWWIQWLTSWSSSGELVKSQTSSSRTSTCIGKVLDSSHRLSLFRITMRIAIQISWSTWSRCSTCMAWRQSVRSRQMGLKPRSCFTSCHHPIGPSQMPMRLLTRVWLDSRWTCKHVRGKTSNRISTQSKWTWMRPIWAKWLCHLAKSTSSLAAMLEMRLSIWLTHCSGHQSSCSKLYKSLITSSKNKWEFQLALSIHRTQREASQAPSSTEKD